MLRLAIAIVTVLLAAHSATASVTRVTISSRATVAGGQSFGPVGPYEKIAGTVFFELDPADPHNKAIADLDLAPRNARGRVEFSADLFILAPQDPARASGIVLFEISNRGGKGLLTTFNRGTASADPMLPEHFGDGLLMRNGFTLVWVGWEFDVAGLERQAASRHEERLAARRNHRGAWPWSTRARRKSASATCRCIRRSIRTTKPRR